MMGRNMQVAVVKPIVHCCLNSLAPLIRLLAHTRRKLVSARASSFGRTFASNLLTLEFKG